MYAGEPVLSKKKQLLALARRAENARRDWIDQVRADIALHRALVELANVPMLTREFDRVMNVGLFLASSGAMPAAAEPHDNHLDLVTSLCTATKPKAEARIRAHILRKGQ
jgi:DNA-binding GntR family transcriptional regulator